MRTLYVNTDAVSQSLRGRFPYLDDEVINHAVKTMEEETATNYSITHLGTIVPPDAFLLTDLETCPEDSDYLPHINVLLTPGPGLFQTRRIAIPEDVENIPVETHHLYRWATTHIDHRTGLLYARHGLETKAISAANKQRLQYLLQTDPPKPRALPTESHTPSVHTSVQRDYDLVTEETLPRFLADIRQIEDQKYMGFDVETEHVPGWENSLEKPGLRLRYDTVCGFSISRGHGTGWYINRSHPGLRSPEAAFRSCHAVISNPDITKVGWNIKFDMTMYRHTFGVKLEGPVHDGMQMAWNLGYDSKFGDTKLKRRALEDLDYRMTEFDELVGKGVQKYRHAGQLPVEIVTPYAGADAGVPLALCDLYLERLRKQGTDRAYEIDRQAIPVIAEMTWNGMPYDMSRHNDVMVMLAQSVREKQAEFERIIGGSCNVASPQQLNNAMYANPNFSITLTDPRGRRAKGQYSTEALVLKKLLVTHPRTTRAGQAIAQLLILREHMNIQSKVKSYPQAVNPNTGRIHGNITTDTAETGRLQCKTPNLMAIPTRSEMGKEIRKLFKAEPGHTMLVADKAQIEPRILSHYMVSMFEDDSLAKVFWEGLDLYNYIGSQILGKPMDQITKVERTGSKTSGLASQYGAQPATIAERASDFAAEPPFIMTVEDAEFYLKGYFAKFPGVKRFLDYMETYAKKNGYAETLFGRRRVIKGIHSGDPQQRREAARQAGNHPIQGTAGDLMKLALIELYAAGMGPYLCMVIHDEFVHEVPTEFADELVPIVKEAIEGIYELAVPIVAEPETGDSWGTAKG